MLKYNEADLMAEGRRVQTMLPSMDAQLPGELKAAKLASIMTTLDTNSAAVKSIKSDLTAAVEAKDASLDELKEFLKRAKAGAKAVFGDDSLEYERLGGKRTSERKRTSKKQVSST